MRAPYRNGNRLRLPAAVSEGDLASQHLRVQAAHNDIKVARRVRMPKNQITIRYMCRFLFG
ncbi:MAG TPA: hypothetical protein PLC74_06360, partial [Acetobacteraceae bacterium]|nr:hypothetical protein [Acetobacteraceae bacterium]